MSNRKASDAIVARPDVMRMYRIAPSNVVQLLGEQPMVLLRPAHGVPHGMPMA
jgi:hypothetical protein